MPSSDPHYLIFLALVAAFLPFVPRAKPRLATLAAISFTFYAQFSPWYAVLLATVSGIAFVGALVIDGLALGRARSLAFAAAVVASLTPLFDEKYFGVIASVMVTLENGGTPALLQVILPVGISFYTFQAVGYLIDVFVGNFRAERSLIRFAAFISFFPQLAAGPIERASHLFPQLDNVGQFDAVRVIGGLRVILLGLFLKIVIADSLGPLVDAMYQSPYEFNAFDLAVGTIYFSFQVYADFAGYTFIAIGSGRLLGIELLPNFAQPYLSHSLPEFWRTWHMSLTSWFRDYMFTPLQFQWRRFGSAGLVAALVITFIVVGAWHGSDWKFAIFGLIHGIMVSFSTLTFKARDRFWQRSGVPVALLGIARIVTTFLVVTLTFVIFRANNLNEGLAIYRKLLTGPFGTLTLPIWPFAFITMLVLGDVIARRGWWKPDSLSTLWRWTVYYAASAGVMITLAIKLLEGEAHVRQFIYFRF